MRKFRRPNRPGPVGTVSMPQPSTSHANSQTPLASSSSTPSSTPTPAPQQASNAPTDRRGNVKDDALDIAINIASVGKDAAGVLNVPGLAPALSALLEILKKIQVMSKTVKGIDALTQDIEYLVRTAANFSERNSRKKIPKALKEAIDDMTSKWAETERRATELAKRSRFKRFLRSASDAKKLENLVEDIRSSIQDTILCTGWETHMLSYGIQQTLENDIKPKLDGLTAQEDEKYMPPYAESAAYGANSARPRQTCLDGTREDILEDAWTWVKLRTRVWNRVNIEGQGGALRNTEGAQGFIHWTCGLAGTGKTTIACSIAKRCKEEGILGASFFFSRFDSKCDNPRLLFTTISRQLCRIHPAYKAKVIAIMKNDPDITNSVPAVQFETLILEPLEQLTEPFPRLAIIIDALDECRNDDNTSTIFYILSKFKDRITRFFLFIMTSRPESVIVAYFDQTRSGPLGEVTTRLFLHTVKLEPVLRDINRFLMHHLKEPVSRRFPPGRPSDKDIAALAILSEGLFIFARTVVNLLTDQKSMDPVATLERIVQRQSHRPHLTSILDELYRQVLDEAHTNAEEELQDPIKRIIGTLVIAAEPLSVITLAALLGLSEYIVRNVLSELYSVLHIPDDSSQPVHFIHPTFPEFLLQASSALALPPRFSFNATEQHCDIVICCFKTTKALLCYDVVNLRDLGVHTKEVPNLPNKIQQHIPSHLSYACRNWIVHFRLGSDAFRSDIVHKLFSGFLHQHLLCWLEVCSLLNKLNEVPAVLDAARHTCQSLEGPFVNLIPFLLDARRFALTYAPCIDAAPLQVYHSALGLAPSSSLVSQTYSDMRRKESLVVCRGAPPEWGPCLGSFSGHRSDLTVAVAFCPDNVSFVSGGSDGMLKIWQASTRTLVLDIKTSNMYIWAVAYSPSGLHISAGGTAGLSIWHAASGAQVRAITDDDIRHVAYTADGSCLLSVSDRGSIQLWRVSNGECLLSLSGDGWNQAGISPDGAVVAFTCGAALLLHYVSSKEHESLELPGQGIAVTFSSDGRYVAAGTKNAIRIWSHHDKLLVRSIDVPTGVSSRLSISPDSLRVCCGCHDRSVYVWPIRGDGPACELKGHTDHVADVAWSPNGFQIISVSLDRTIRLWDVSDHLPTGQPSALSDRRSSSPTRVLVVKFEDDDEPDFTIMDLAPHSIADLALLYRNDSTSDDDAPVFTSHPSRAVAWDDVVHSTALWLPDRAYHWAALTGRNMLLSGARFVISNDGSLVAYANSRRIYIRNLITGALVTTLRAPEVHSMVFSPNDCYVASGSKTYSMVAVWDVARGTRITYRRGDFDGVDCVAFSSDSRLVAFGPSDKTARVFDIPTGQVIGVLGRHDDHVMQVMLTTDNRLLVTQDAGGSLYIWNIRTGSCIASFRPSNDLWISTLHFSPTGFSISAEDCGYTVELWKVGRRAWPVYYISEEGWVYAKGPGYTRRLAWLPPGWRHPVYSHGAVFCVCEAESDQRDKLWMRNVIEIDMSKLLDHAGVPYNKQTISL